MRVALFPTCLGDPFFTAAVEDAHKLLSHLGVEVVRPRGATCCGQPAWSTGFVEEGERVARHTVGALAELDGIDHVVVPSGSCTAMLRHHVPELLGAGDEDDPLGAVCARTRELGEFVREVLGMESTGTGLDGRRVAYHHGCHALRTLRSTASEELLRAAGAEVVAWEAATECCGFGGLFSTKFPAVSGAMADRKLDTLPAVDVLTSADPGCLLQLGGRAERRGVGPPVRHVASLLWEAVG